MRRITTKLVLAYLAVAIPFGILLGFTFYERYGARVNQIYDDRESFARIVGTNFVGFVRGVSVAIDVAGHSIAGGQISPSDANALLADLSNEYPSLRYIAFVDPAGMTVASGNAAVISRTVASQRYFKQVAEGADVVVSDYGRQLGGDYGFVIASPVREEGRVAGVMIAMVDATTLGAVVPVPRSGGTNIVDTRGTLVYQNEYPRMPLRLRDWRRFDFVRKALRGETARSDSFVFPVDTERRFITQVPIEEFGWAAGSGVEAGAALAPVAEDALRAGLAAAIIFVFASGVALLFGARISRPIADLARKARRIGEERLDEPIEIKTGDEIEILANELETARTKLRSSFSSLNLLLEASSRLNQRLDLSAIAASISDTLVPLLGVDRVLVAAFGNTIAEVTFSETLGSPYGSQGAESASSFIQAFPALRRRLSYERKAFILDADDPGMGDEAKRYLASLSVRSTLVCPLLVGERTVGVIVADKRGEKKSFPESDVELADAVGAQAAMAIVNAQLYEKERDVAETLQQALLIPPETIPGVEVDFVYEPALGQSMVGGDFYDVFEVDGKTIAFVIGDVSGKGLEVASTTATAKSTIRAFAYEDSRTATIAARANSVLARQIEKSRYVTAIIGVLDIENGHLEMTNAGHPDAIICAKGGCRFLHAGKRNSALGLFSDVSFGAKETDLSPGDAIILYTDGLIEARHGAELFGEKRVIGLVRESESVPRRDVLVKLVEAARAFGEGRLRDDIAIVALRLVIPNVRHPAS